MALQPPSGYPAQAALTHSPALGTEHVSCSGPHVGTLGCPRAGLVPPTSALEPPPVLLCISMGECQLPSCPQFVCVECLVTASVDMFPSQLRKSGRRELLILAIAVVCYLIGLFLVTEVSVWGGVACRMGSRVREPGATPSLSATWGC